MDLQAALVHLSLEHEELTRDRVRRAYMRKLRAHSPERDPEGFRRLRDAYEQVLEQVHDDGAASASVPAGSSPRLVAEPSGEPVAAASSAPSEIGLSPAPLPPAQLPPAEMLAMLLGNLEQGYTHAAAAWMDELRSIPTTGLDQDLAIRWILARQLFGIAHLLPKEVTAALARAIASGNLGSARSELEAYATAQPARAADANDLLYHRARPIYAANEGTLLATRYRRVFWRVSRALHNRKAVRLVLLIFVLAAFLSGLLFDNLQL